MGFGVSSGVSSIWNDVRFGASRCSHYLSKPASDPAFCMCVRRDASLCIPQKGILSPLRLPVPPSRHSLEVLDFTASFTFCSLAMQNTE
jgi:hypothetical protein